MPEPGAVEGGARAAPAAISATGAWARVAQLRARFSDLHLGVSTQLDLALFARPESRIGLSLAGWKARAHPNSRFGDRPLSRAHAPSIG